jgi:hypothetical protein
MHDIRVYDMIRILLIDIAELNPDKVIIEDVPLKIK